MWAASSEKRAYGYLKNVCEVHFSFRLSTMKVFIDFALIPLKIKCYSILQKRLSRILDISNCDVIYYVIYVICSHYVGKAISSLFAWPSSCLCCIIVSLSYAVTIHFKSMKTPGRVTNGRPSEREQMFVTSERFTLRCQACQNLCPFLDSTTDQVRSRQN